LHAGTHSRLAVVGGILTIAIADSFSDALGIHIAEESKPDSNSKAIWISTLSTLAAKFIFALTFLVPVLIFELNTAIGISVGWGIIMLTGLNYYIARAENNRAWPIIIEHLLIAIVVIVLTHYVGDLIGKIFK